MSMLHKTDHNLMSGTKMSFSRFENKTFTSNILYVKCPITKSTKISVMISECYVNNFLLRPFFCVEERNFIDNRDNR